MVPGKHRQPDVLFVTGREPSYVRNEVFRRALARRSQVYVSTDAVRPASWRYAKALFKTAVRLKQRPDLVLVGFYGQPLMPAMHILSRRPVVLDAFVSTYDTLCVDRQRFRPKSLPGRLAFQLDYWSCRWADLVLVDSEANLEYFHQTFGLPRDGIAVVYTGCDESEFTPRVASAPLEAFQVFTHSSFLPLHGIEYVLQAAKRLQGEAGIVFTIAGSGPRLATMKRMAEELSLGNVQLPGWLPHDELPEHIARADLCLGGHFSSIPKAGRHIATKTFQFLAMAKPTIVGDSPANREVMCHRQSAYLCPVADAQALADAILELRADPHLCRELADQGRALYLRRFTTDAIADDLQRAFGRLGL